MFSQEYGFTAYGFGIRIYTIRISRGFRDTGSEMDMFADTMSRHTRGNLINDTRGGTSPVHVGLSSGVEHHRNLSVSMLYSNAIDSRISIYNGEANSHGVTKLSHSNLHSNGMDF